MAKTPGKNVPITDHESEERPACDNPMSIQPVHLDASTPMQPVGSLQHEGPLQPSRSVKQKENAGKIRKASLKKQRDQQSD